MKLKFCEGRLQGVHRCESSAAGRLVLVHTHNTSALELTDFVLEQSD
jgi:hypothetical protein